jgi:alginate O-acetyltransferase complex protein AlgI
MATSWLGIICYTFQIFFDFSGYSDMAIGLGKMFGFDFHENFNYPYISKTITEFWRRWHISLSSWFRDYVYIPLGGNRRGNVYINLLVVFVLTGFWHGAAFQFIAWGLWHGLFLIIERRFNLRDVKKRPLVPLRYVLTMLVIIIGWVFFRAPGLPYALKYLGVMFNLVKSENVGYTAWFYLNSKVIFALIFAVIASTPLLRPKKWGFQQNPWYKGLSNVFILIILFISIVFVVSSSYNPFIYFRF